MKTHNVTTPASDKDKAGKITFEHNNSSASINSDITATRNNSESVYRSKGDTSWELNDDLSIKFRTYRGDGDVICLSCDY